jgi:hypothetical protein
VDETIPIFKQVCGALAEAHRQGVVHRDVKPENIVLVERSGQKLFPIVVDFGIARLVQEESDAARITRTGTVCGSPTYMSPEQCTSSKVDHRSDIYSLGVVIYESLTGEVPFLSDELVKVMAMHLSDPPKPLNQVREDLQFSKALEEVVYKALAKNPDQRFQSMEEFAQALEDSLKEPAEPVVVAAPVMPKRPEIKPGPLAQDESIESGRESARKPTLETSTSQPTSKALDLASRALEQLRSSGVYEDAQGNPIDGRIASTAAGRAYQYDKQGVENMVASQINREPMPGRTNFQRGRGNMQPTFLERIQAVLQMALWVALILVVVAGLLVFAANNNPQLAKFLPWKGQTSKEADDLVKQGKFEQALYVLQGLKPPLPKSETELLGKVCIQLAKQYAKDNRYDDAIAVLQQVPKNAASAPNAREMLKRYRQIIEKSQK